MVFLPIALLFLLHCPLSVRTSLDTASTTTTGVYRRVLSSVQPASTALFNPLLELAAGQARSEMECAATALTHHHHAFHFEEAESSSSCRTGTVQLPEPPDSPKYPDMDTVPVGVHVMTDCFKSC